MSTFDDLSQVATGTGPAAELAKDLLVFNEQYDLGKLDKEEYTFLVQQIAEVRAAQDLADDEVACRFIVAAAEGLLAVV